MSTAKKVCIITGVGPGTGTALVERFAEGGYAVAMIARDAERLNALAEKIPGSRAFICDVTDFAALGEMVATVKSEMGAPTVLVHNAVGGAIGTYLEVEPEVLDMNFQINTMALYHLARMLVPDMIAAGGGAILATGNTSAYRGKAAFASFAPTKAAQRILLESIARASGPDGIHAAYVAIDAIIDVPWTREVFADKPDEYFCQPADIAGEVYHVAHQPKSTWTSDVMIRPYNEEW